MKTKKPNEHLELNAVPNAAVNFNVSVKLDMKEMEHWKPERIAAFFSGLARIMAAKVNKDA